MGSSALACYYIHIYLFILMSGALGPSPAALNCSFYENYKWTKGLSLHEDSIFSLLQFKKIPLTCFLLVRVFPVILFIAINTI